ncbi:diguanylate cyclase [Ramlibacter sp. H39-3-26]|uniref:sensor domain-containing diguanylate cyclase n=1 Tax=Curvibacter soli TaxID=3031331 RepID=UPI0023DA19DC|nr:diguanylate cyclase [Ramlibacter sp. H39-3-26]MDF1486644.1 diguanylate cyclase [Ramlibacter sp. H39-3-26]
MDTPAREAAGARRRRWRLPAFGGTLALRAALAAMLCVLAAGAASTYLAARENRRDAMERLVRQQAGEAEVVAGLLASKVEQSQKVLRSLAAGITAEMLDSSSPLEYLLLYQPTAAQFFDSILVARADGLVRLNMLRGRFLPAAELSAAQRDYLLRTLVQGKPGISEPLADASREPTVLFTVPMLDGDGRVMGVVGGGLRLQSQGLLPSSMALLGGGDSRLMVYTRDGTILSHPDPARIMGQVRDEPGVGPAYAQWLRDGALMAGAGSARVAAGYVVGMAGMPAAQWVVARVGGAQQALRPLQGGPRSAWQAAAATGLCAAAAGALVFWMAWPVTQLSRRAAALLDGEPAAEDAGWPHARGEVGALAQVLRRVAHELASAHRAQQAMAGQLQAILHSASVGIAVVRRGRLHIVGQHACHMFGYGAGELRGQPVRALHPSAQARALLHARVRADFAIHGYFDGEVLLRRKDGSEFWAHLLGRGIDAADAGAGTIWILEDVTAAREAKRKLSWAAAHDSLTQLVNRHEFMRRLQQALGAGDAAVLFVDLDHFKVLNDSAGHAAGDDALRHLARLLEAEARQGDTVARLGGDEFAMLLPACPLERAQDMAECLRRAVAAWEPRYGPDSYGMGVSIGIAMAGASLGGDEALHAADMACDAAKRRGRNCVVAHSAA